MSSSSDPASSSSYLLFQLYGPMASWGDVAVGEVRPTFDHPSKSAILGMVAAALGIRRSEEEKHWALASQYRFAARLDVPGRLLRDYQNAWAPEKGAPTRRDELERRDLNNIQSYRDYRCDARATACLWTEAAEPRWDLWQMRQALEEPEFTLYLGRKACPPALPLAPTVTEALSLREAFASTSHSDDPFTEALMAGRDTVRLYWEETESSGLEADQTQTRRDQPVSRARWQFAERSEQYTSIPPGQDAA